MYEYAGTVIRVVDGDTLHVEVDLGMNIRTDMSLRLYGINAPEKDTQAGRDAKEVLELLLPVSRLVIVRTFKDRREKYGRYLATVWLKGDDMPMSHEALDGSVNERMVKEGHAVPYFGGART